MTTYKMVKKSIEVWNENHPETQLELSVYNGYYHIGYAGPHDSIKYNFIVQPGPRATVEAFRVWKEGYCAGLENA